MFKDRKHAGQLLAARLTNYRDEDVVVLGIPRGGLPVASEIAQSLKAPLDVVLTKKIGHPFNKEYAIGAVSLEDAVLSKESDKNDPYVQTEILRLRDTLKKRDAYYHRNSPPKILKGKVLILVDDGIATGNTFRAAVRLLAKKQPAKVVAAIPVVPPEAVEKLRYMKEVDEVVCLATPDNFHAVGQFYDSFPPVSDEEALACL